MLSDLRREKQDNSEFAASKLMRKKTKLKKIISIIAFIVLCTAVVIYMLNNPSKNVKPPKHTQLTFEGNIYLVEAKDLFEISQISPDGQLTAYVTDNEIEKSLFVKDNFGDQAVEIFKGLEAVSNLRWSPNGNEIFFSGGNLSSWSSYVIPRLGGKAQKLKYIGIGCWSPNEKLIAGVQLSLKQIGIIKRETGEVLKTIQLAEDFTWLLDIDWSPNGDKILFLSQDDNIGKYAIWTIKTDGTQQKKILENTGVLYSPKWSLDGNHIYYLQENGPTQDLMKVEVSSNSSEVKPKAIQTGLLAYGFTITKDNKKFCYTKYNTYSNLWLFNYDERKKLFNSKKLTKGTSIFEMPVISPDGKEIAYINKGNINKMSINGESVKQLTFSNSYCFSPSWGPNGKEIAFLSESAGLISLSKNI